MRLGYITEDLKIIFKMLLLLLQAMSWNSTCPKRLTVAAVCNHDILWEGGGLVHVCGKVCVCVCARGWGGYEGEHKREVTHCTFLGQFVELKFIAFSLEMAAMASGIQWCRI